MSLFCLTIPRAADGCGTEAWLPADAVLGRNAYLLDRTTCAPEMGDRRSRSTAADKSPALVQLQVPSARPARKSTAAESSLDTAANEPSLQRRRPGGQRPSQRDSGVAASSSDFQRPVVMAAGPSPSAVGSRSAGRDSGGGAHAISSSKTK